MPSSATTSTAGCPSPNFSFAEYIKLACYLDRILAPTVPLSRHIFRAPTRFHKTGVVFMAWLNDHQDHFTTVGGRRSARPIGNLADLFRLADATGLLRDPEMACARMRSVLATRGVH